jgi:hypothetical protein
MLVEKQLVHPAGLSWHRGLDAVGIRRFDQHPDQNPPISIPDRGRGQRFNCLHRHQFASAPLLIGTMMETAMSGSEASGIDLIRELRLRQWARTHYVPEATRPDDWHPVVLDEMRRRDEELYEARGRSRMSGLNILAEAS